VADPPDFVELARRKMNVVLISRTQSKLEAAAKEIEEAHNVETRVVAIDFSSFGKEVGNNSVLHLTIVTLCLKAHFFPETCKSGRCHQGSGHWCSCEQRRDVLFSSYVLSCKLGCNTVLPFPFLERFVRDTLLSQLY
jgi:hypothetical protein